MKPTILKPIETLVCALLLTAVIACGPARPTTVEAQDAAAKPAAAPATPAGAIHYDAQTTGSKMKIEGTSTLHDWSMESGIVGGYLEADAKFPESALTDPKAAKPNVQVFTPVKSFKSGTKAMDSGMYRYLKEPEFKRIDYRLLELNPKSAAGATGPLQFEAVGALTVSGITITNTMPVTIEKTGDKLKVVGKAPLKCSNFKLEPYSFLGLSCGDDLKISFEWSLAPKAP